MYCTWWSKDLGSNKIKNMNIYRPVSDRVRSQGFRVVALYCQSNIKLYNNMLVIYRENYFEKFLTRSSVKAT